MTNKTPSSSNTELPDGMKFDDLTALAEPNEVDMQIKSIDDLATEIAEYLDEVIREYPSHAAAQLARQFLLENF